MSCMGTRMIHVKKRLADERGIMTLEATIVFPVFMALMLLLISFIKIGMVYLAMDHAVSETAKQIATHTYPLKFVQQGLGEMLEKLNVSTLQPDSEIARKIITAAKDDVSQAAMDYAMEEAVKRYIIENYIPAGIVSSDQVDIKVKMCNPWASDGFKEVVNNVELQKKDIAVVATYKVKLVFPFVPVRELTLSNTAIEKAWLEP